MTESSIKIIKQLGPSVLKAKMPNDVVDKFILVKKLIKQFI